MLKAVEKRRAYEDIVKQIRDLIEKGRLKKDDLADIFFIRKIIEPAVAQLAAEHATREEEKRRSSSILPTSAVWRV